MDITRLRGIGVSPGIAMGEVVARRAGRLHVARARSSPAGQVEDELRRLRRALEPDPRGARPGQGATSGRRWGRSTPSSSRPTSSSSRTRPCSRRAREGHPRGEGPRRVGPVQGPTRATSRSSRPSTDEYFRQRKSDVSDVLAKIYRNLETRNGRRRRSPRRQNILVAHELLPSEAALSLSGRTDPGRRPGHGRPDLPHGHPGPVPEHPGRRRPARHHPPGPRTATSSSSTGPTARSSSTRPRPSAASSWARRRSTRSTAGSSRRRPS